MQPTLLDRLIRYLPAILIHVAVIVAWYLWVAIGEVPEYVMPSPGKTFAALWEDYNWIHNTMITGGEVFFGYFLAVFVGVGLALRAPNACGGSPDLSSGGQRPER